MRLWDARAGRSVRRISTVFGEDPVAAVCWAGDAFFAAAGSTVHEFDLRGASTPILVTSATHSHALARDEVNVLLAVEGDTSPVGDGAPFDGRPGGCTGLRRPLLVAGDDTGDVVVVDVAARTQWRRLKGRHDGFCSSVTAPPRHSLPEGSPPVLVSGGLDATLAYWDASVARSRMAVSIVPMEDDGAAASASGAQLLNPPLVHCVAFNRDGSVLAAALGDATVAFYKAQHSGRDGARPLAQLGRIGGCHAAAVTRVVWPTFGDATSLVSCANDGTVLVWNTAAALAGAAAAQAEAEAAAAATGTSGSGKRRRRRRKGKAKRAGESASAGTGDGRTGDDAAARDEASAGAGKGETIRLKIAHGSNPNWLATTSILGGTVAVADTSNDVTLYSGVL